MRSEERGHTLSIRDATADDIGRVVEIERGSFGDPWSEASFRQLLDAESPRFRVAVADGFVCGFSVAWVVAEEAELANIAVDPEWRRMGVGAALLDELLAFTDRGRGVTIFLEVRVSNLPAQALYRSRGFVAAGVRKAYYSKPTEDAMVMRRDPRIGASVRPVI